MTELEKLIQQRQELDAKIKALTCPKVEVDGAKFYVKTHRGQPLDAWVVTVEQIGRNAAYKELVYAKTKEEAIEGIYNLIYSLTLLADTVDPERIVAEKMRR